MRYQVVPILVVIGIGLVVGGTQYDPMVAFVCNKGAMHMDPKDGWYSDSRTDCLESKDNILNYCKTVYPSLEITNIVETSDLMTIKGWCPLGDKDCSAAETFKVRPYRCLTGPFQSDALVVPHKCQFDHIHDKDQCNKFDYWADVAKKSCSDLHQMDTDSFAMLLPCGTDMFTGVEFVCCPADVDKDEAETTPSAVDVPKINVKVSMPGKDEKNPVSLDLVEKYMHLPVTGDYDNEHDMYELAKKQMLASQHDSVTKLMKAWSEARDRVTKLKANDPKKAETQNTDITDRYQKEYFALQAQNDGKALQMDAVHQQHVQANLNYKKRVTMQKLMEELQSQYYDVEYIVEMLQKYISVEEKDAHHCIKHFIKVRSRDTQAAQHMLPATIEHITLISTRINQSIDLLDTLKDKNVVEKMKTSMKAWVAKTFVSLDKTVTQFKTLTSAPVTPKTSPEPPMLPEIEVDEVKPAAPQQPKINVKIEKSAASTEDNKNMYKMYAEKLSKTDFVKKPAIVVDVASLDEEEEPEDEHALQVNNLRAQEMNAEVQGLNSRQSGVSSNLGAGASVAIACGVIAAMMVVVFAILIVKKRSRKSNRLNNHYLEVAVDAPELSPEDRHIAAMQNGYENPTYRLLEHMKA